MPSAYRDNAGFKTGEFYPRLSRCELPINLILAIEWDHSKSQRYNQIGRGRMFPYKKVDVKPQGR